MAKLSHKISGNNNNNNNNNSSNKNVKMGFSLSTKIEKNDGNPPKTNTGSNEATKLDKKIIETPLTVNKIVETVGIEKFGTLTKDDFAKLFPAETTLDAEIIKKEIIKKVLTSKLDSELEKLTSDINQKYAELVKKYEEAEQKLQKKETQIRNLTEQVEDAEARIFKTEKNFAESVPVEQLLASFIKKNIANEYTKKISDLLHDAYKNDTRNGAKFVFGFLKGFVIVENTILQLGDDEKENLEALNNSGRNLMTEISELSVSERRPILDIVANMFNNYLQNYDFVSPEQTLQIDPSIHNVEGMGGTVVKEGLSFAVLRRETRKTVYYADISTR